MTRARPETGLRRTPEGADLEKPAAGKPSLDFGHAWDYAPAPETAKVAIAPRYGHFINGKFVEPRAGERFATVNPATEQVLSEIAQGSQADIDAAVRAAAAAQ